MSIKEHEKGGFSGFGQVRCTIYRHLTAEHRLLVRSVSKFSSSDHDWTGEKVEQQEQEKKTEKAPASGMSLKQGLPG
ncbi:MAG: hypothetical protein K0R67_2889 [Paenibacillus sp.]|jgi:hypothetical protein|nr:hypothetical protein [Paenibacillus sp.]